MRIKLSYLITTGCLAAIALSFQGKAAAQPPGAGTPVLDQTVASNIQALNNSSHADASMEIGLLQQQLQTMGDPQQYINMLQRNNQLSVFTQMASSQNVNTATQVMQNANSSSGLTYNGATGKTLYPADLSKATGITDQTSFKKFGVLQDMVDDYQTKVTTYNQQMQSLQTQLQKAMSSLDQAKTQVETLKYQAEVNGLNALITALASRMNVAGEEALLQQAANQNEIARAQEVTRQQKANDQRNQMNSMIQYLKQSTGSGSPPMR
jgi:hypothetical protein